MTPFSEALKGFSFLSEARITEAFTESTDEVRRSVLTGSELTGAPGQPVDTGNLLNSWHAERVSETRWQLSTNTAYAEYIEDGGNSRGQFNPARGDPRSEVGGYHSVKLTRTGWDRIVEAVARRIAGR